MISLVKLMHIRINVTKYKHVSFSIQLVEGPQMEEQNKEKRKPKSFRGTSIHKLIDKLLEMSKMKDEKFYKELEPYNDELTRIELSVKKNIAAAMYSEVISRTCDSFNYTFVSHSEYSRKIFRDTKFDDVLQFIDSNLSYSRKLISSQELVSAPELKTIIECERYKIQCLEEIKKFIDDSFFESDLDRKQFMDKWIEKNKEEIVSPVIRVW
jgi:hypothetical protein